LSGDDFKPDLIETMQEQFCLERNLPCVHATGDSILGFALSTKGRLPINGLRHPVVGSTNGWYLWCGEDLSSARDFFSPTHARHIYEDLPAVAKLLGLPPGYRFLLAGDYLDVWYDEALLAV